MDTDQQGAGFFGPQPTLRGERVLLRPFVAEDAEAMGVILADPEVQRLTGSVTSSEEAAAASPIPDDTTRTWYATRAECTDRLDLAVVDTRTGELVGEVVLNELEPERRACNFRVLIGPSGRDRGLGSEAIQLFITHAFAATRLERIELGVLDFNPRARRVYERVGFRQTGVLRREQLFDGVWHDEVMMAVERGQFA